MERRVESRIAGLARLAEPVRRALYLYVAGRREEVSRHEAARAAKISRGLAGFHLDRLVEEGLLEASFKRLSGRAGPGAGRPAKVYRRSGREIEVSVPPRSYDLAARVLVTAVEASDSPKTRKALSRAARGIGEGIGAQARACAGAKPGRKKLLAGMVAALEENGFEPQADRAAGEIRLRNCPFQSLARDHAETVCGMNLALIEGVVAGLQLPSVKPVLDSAPGMCCVRLDIKADS
ncbi:MAG TPA: transcriptional regulator [Thermoanaerobaculia bacterium]|nr:transcriptional regulator [Thermoanaerobaculia bacterium]